MANFLHGVETRESTVGPLPVRSVKTGVIALVGTALTGSRQEMVLVQSPDDAAQFGPELPGFTIAKSIRHILNQGVGLIVVVNIYDPATHTVQVTNESRTPTGGKFKLAFAPTSNLVIKSNDDSVTYTLNSDYSVDAYGNVTVLNATAMPDSTAVRASYKRLDASLVTASNFIGAITSGVRTGLKLYEECYTRFGFTPKLFITPWYSSLSSLTAELVVQATKYRAFCGIDAPIGVTPTQAIQGRGGNGSVNFNTSSPRAMLCYPHLTATELATGNDELIPLSVFWAGATAAQDNENGTWFSPSNREILGVTGYERAITFQVNAANTEANLLNENGITTYAKTFGSGIRLWGNRSAAWPTVTDPKNFQSVRRTYDAFHEELELTSFQFIDKPINNHLFGLILALSNEYMNKMIQKGAFVPGGFVYVDPAKNSATDIAAGQMTFSIRGAVVTPGERLIFDSIQDITLYRNLVQ